MNSHEEDGLKLQTDRDRGRKKEERRANNEKKLNEKRVFGVTQRSSEKPESSINSIILFLEFLGGRATHKGMQRLRERA